MTKGRNVKQEQDKVIRHGSNIGIIETEKKGKKKEEKRTKTYVSVKS